MALRYPGTPNIPQYESSLAAFMPAFEKGQTERKDADAFDAAARAFGGGASTPAPQQPQSPLERLMGVFSGGQQQQAQLQPQGPYTRPQPPATAVAAIDQAAPPQAIAPDAPRMDTANIPAGYLASARASESGGNDAARNPSSSATGRYQFLEGTWNGLMRQYPELGLTADGRTDPAQQERAMAQFTQDNARALSSAGIPVDPGTLYAAHFLGAGGAQEALTADPATPMASLVDPAVIEANPQLAQMNAGEFAQWAQQKGGNRSGGYQPPMQDVGAGQGRPFQVDEGTMRTLLASEATRPLAVSLIQAQQETQASQGRFVTEEGDDGAIWQRDTLTGERKVLREPAPADGLINAGDGNIYDPNSGKWISAPAGAQPLDPPEVETRYNPETGQEEKVTWNAVTGAWEPFGGQKAPSNGLTVTTNPDGTTTVTQGGGKLTEGQSKDTVYATRANAAMPLLDQYEQKLLSFGENLVGNVPYGNYAQSEEYQLARDAGLEYLASILRKDTGAAVTPSEEALYGRIFLPQPGDKPATVAAKRQRRALAVAAIEAGMPPQALENMAKALESAGGTPEAAPPPQAGEGPVTISDDAGYEALPSGARFIGPDGLERVKP